jgi:hypothetical protein
MAQSQLEAAQLLFEKLTRDLARLEGWPNDVDMAFNFFLTAEHIVDWLYPDPAGLQRREDLHKDPLLRVVWELASGAKHFDLITEHTNPVASASDQAASLRGPISPDPYQPGRDRRPKTVVTVELTGEAAQKYGSRLSALDLARIVHAYWNTQLHRRHDKP